MASTDTDSSFAPPYATGGGGTRLEHLYGATFLAALLSGDPVPELGDDIAPKSVHFQASRISPVDDLVVESSHAGVRRRVSIGVRRAPKLTASDEESVPLLRSYLRVLLEHHSEVSSGHWRLSLAVVNANPAVKQLKELAVVARACDDSDEFRVRAEQSEFVNKPARTRLNSHLDVLVAKAAEGLAGRDTVTNDELTWRLLSVLQVRELRLEGAEETDRTLAVRLLRSVVTAGTVAAADSLFSKLVELTGTYAPSSAQVTERTLRRDLVGSSLLSSPTYESAWTLFRRLEQRLKDWTRSDLRDGETAIELKRTEARESLAHKISALGTTGTLVVTGEPDVGKSALTLRVVAQLASEQKISATAMSMPDLPMNFLELEKQLEASLEDVFAGRPTNPVHLLVLDGAEVALAGKASLLQEICLAALRTGISVVAITRADGAAGVKEILTQATRTAGTEFPHEHTVPPLTAAETSQLMDRFPVLRRIGAEERSHWLLNRPGLVELLLRTDRSSRTDDLLSEADIFSAVWESLVLNNDQTRPGEPTPHEREDALIAVAQHGLEPGKAPRPSPAVLRVLRSDGLLKTDDFPAPFRTREQFSSDLIRDFALTRLLLKEGWQVLADAGAPRWAIRAVRMACQATLRSRVATWRELETTFARLAEQSGQRWSELPLEAVLTLGDAGETLKEIYPALSAGSDSRVETLVRLCLQQHSEGGIGDPLLLAPVVELVFAAAAPTPSWRPRRSRDNQICQLILAWLRGLIFHGVGTHPLRQQVRDTILASEPASYDEFAVEAIATLGPDLDSAAENFLRKVADDTQSYNLGPAVESTGAVRGMAEHRPDLLIHLADCYYIDSGGQPGRGYLEKGIRPHWNKMGSRQASWHFGPFWGLLTYAPVDALALINRILDHAARMHVRNGLRRDARVGTVNALPGLDLELPGLGSRRYIGDDDVWSWYRGISNGPAPCISALLAVEHFADGFVETGGIEMRRIVSLLLSSCTNLAMPGLVVGLLVRHIHRAEDLLDPWLTYPEIWRFESSRSGRENFFHFQGADNSATPGREHRGFSFLDVAVRLTSEAKIRGDQARLEALENVGNALLSSGHAVGDPDSASEELSVIARWASAFRPENHKLVEGGVLVQFENPEPVATAPAPDFIELRATSQAIRLGNVYAASNDRTASVDTLIEDIAIVRHLADGNVGSPLFIDDAVGAVAAAALVAHTDGQAHIRREDLHWAVQTLLDAATASPDALMRYAGTTYPRGMDRSAAAALPLVLAAPFDGLGVDRTKLASGLLACATSPFDEVRTAFANAGQWVWGMPCDGTSSDLCRHRFLWEAAKAGLRDARIGPWDEHGQYRLPDPVFPPYDVVIAGISADCLQLNHLVPVLGAAASALLAPCVTDEAEKLLPVLLDAHCRTVECWAKDGFLYDNDQQGALVARVLVSLALGGNPEPLIEHVRRFTHHANALHALLDDVSSLCTYDDTVRPHLEELWRLMMTTALDTVDAGATLVDYGTWANWAVAALLPTPHLSPADTEPDSTLVRARAGWLRPDSIIDLIDRWLPLAQGRPKAVDAIVQFAKCNPSSWQLSTGLLFAEKIINGQYPVIANQCLWLTDWLAELRQTDLHNPDTIASWRRIVDGLAAANDGAAAHLQKLEE
ncbi:hypothetical protein ACQGFJ_32150 [Rhodococcus sp. 3.70]